MSGGNVPRIALWIISEFKLNDHLKIDSRKVDVLLLGLRNDYQFHLFRKAPFAPSTNRLTDAELTAEIEKIKKEIASDKISNEEKVRIAYFTDPANAAEIKEQQARMDLVITLYENCRLSMKNDGKND